MATGRERVLIYKTLLLTGLRKNELATLTAAQLDLTTGSAFLQLDAADEKSGEGNAVAIRDDLAAELRIWLDAKLASLQDAARDTGEPIPTRLPAGTLVFDVPAGLVRILNRDLKAAGISKRDDRGRAVDVHAMRTTFGTLLSTTGTSPRTAQAAMRHSDIRLTMGVYTDPRLLDVRTAVKNLPSMTLPGAETVFRVAGSATEAIGESDCVTPDVTPARYNRGQSGTISGKAGVLMGRRTSPQISTEVLLLTTKNPR